MKDYYYRIYQARPEVAGPFLEVVPQPGAGIQKFIHEAIQKHHLQACVLLHEGKLPELTANILNVLQQDQVRAEQAGDSQRVQTVANRRAEIFSTIVSCFMDGRRSVSASN